MAREELAQFAVGRLGVARAHSIDRREVALLFRESAGEAAQARQFFSAFDRIYSFFSSDDPRFRRTLGEASRTGAVSFHRFRPAAKGHVAAGYLAEVGADSRTPMVLNFLSRDLESATRALSGLAEPGKFVAIFPGSGGPSKNWPAAKFAALAQRLEEETCPIFVLGPAEEAIEGVVGDAGNHPVLKHLPLGTVAALARLASAFVGVDSGVSHLAAAAGKAGSGALRADRSRTLASARTGNGHSARADRCDRGRGGDACDARVETRRAVSAHRHESASAPLRRVPMAGTSESNFASLMQAGGKRPPRDKSVKLPRSVPGS